MKIAVPVHQGSFSPHFGGAEAFAPNADSDRRTTQACRASKSAARAVERRWSERVSFTTRRSRVVDPETRERTPARMSRQHQRSFDSIPRPGNVQMVPLGNR